MTADPRRPVLDAAYSGICAACDERFPAGTRIALENDGWVHASCPDPQRAERKPCDRCWQVPSASGACGCDS